MCVTRKQQASSGAVLCSGLCFCLPALPILTIIVIIMLTAHPSQPATMHRNFPSQSRPDHWQGTERVWPAGWRRVASNQQTHIERRRYITHTQRDSPETGKLSRVAHTTHSRVREKLARLRSSKEGQFFPSQPALDKSGQAAHQFLRCEMRPPLCVASEWRTQLAWSARRKLTRSNASSPIRRTASEASR